MRARDVKDIAQGRPAGRDGRVASGLTRGTVAAMAMTGLRQLTTGLGFVEQTPPDAIFRQRASAPLARSPRLALLVERREQAVVELAHWVYGAVGGGAYALLPRSVLRNGWAGPAYGVVTWALFEMSLAPLLGLDKAGKQRPVERLAFAIDHLLYGAILGRSGARAWVTRRRRGLPRATSRGRL